MCDDDGLESSKPTTPSIAVHAPGTSIKLDKDEEVFAFDGEGEQKATMPVNLTDSSDDAEAINKIIDQFEMSITGGGT